MKMTDESWSAVCALMTEISAQSARFDAITNGIMLAPESPIRDAFWRVCESAISACSSLIGDEFGYLAWYAYECDFGASPNKAGCPGNLKMIDSLDKLRWVIEMDCNENTRSD